MAGDGVLLHVAHAVLSLALGTGAKRRARPRSNVPVPAERLEPAVEPNLARLRVVLVDQRFGVVDEQRLRPSSEMGKRGLDAGEPRALALVPKRAREPPA